MSGPGPTDDVQLINGLQRLTYAWLPEHRLLADGYERPEGPNIGAAGEHLTIMFLSMDRPAMSARLCQSIVEHIPHFKGEILAIDNGSQPAELAEIEAMLEALPLRTRLVKLGQNYGVAGGRNRGVDLVQTPWVMSVDNDIYFTRDPLPHWQQEIAAVGCRFFSLALYDPGEQTVFLRGGNIYLHPLDGQIHLGGGSAGKAEDSRPIAGEVFLGTCMMGGACLFDAARFRQMGGFDDNMFVGFEDYEFSIRLFREGYKIGCSALAALVHDHAAPSTEVDKAYEQVRFKRDYIKESAAYMERKHGFKVWNQGVDIWLKQRERELGLDVTEETIPESPPPASDPAPGASPGPAAPATPAAAGRRPHVLLVPDTGGWAFANISEQIERHLSHRFDITIAAAHDLATQAQLPLLARDADLVHVFWRPSIATFVSGQSRDYARGLGYRNPQEYIDYVLNARVTTAVYDHLWLDPAGAEAYGPLFERFVDGYYTSSNRLDAIYRGLHPGAPPLAAIPDGVDTARFQPANLDRLAHRDRPLVVGWVGNSKWTAEQEDFKGLHTVLNPAIEQLRGEGIEIVQRYADRQDGFIPHARMAGYYAGIDVLVCASKIEGTPNPVLEAMACGVPVVTTNVGIVDEALGPQQQSFILRERSVEAMAYALRRLVLNRPRLEELSRENLEQVKAWDWSVRVQPFGDFFDEVLSRPARAKDPGVLPS